MFSTQLSPPPNGQPLPRKRLHLSLPDLYHGAAIFSAKGRWELGLSPVLDESS